MRLKKTIKAATEKQLTSILDHAISAEYTIVRIQGEKVSLEFTCEHNDPINEENWNSADFITSTDALAYTVLDVFEAFYREYYEFQEFQETVEVLNPVQSANRLGVYLEEFQATTVKVHHYDKHYTIEQYESGRFYLMVGRNEHVSDKIEPLEKKLFEWWKKYS